MTQHLFITGTDTDIGKTLAAKALLQAFNQAGVATAGFKPIAAGCEMTDGELKNSDALTLQNASSVKLDYSEVNPFALTAPLSPHLSAKLDHCDIDEARLDAGLENLSAKAELVLTEGAGGWLVPLSDTRSLNQWVAKQQLPVVLVVGIKLGCLNHAMLSKRVIEADGLNLVGWIANHVDPNAACQQQNIDYLTEQLGTPLLGRIPFLDGDKSQLAHYIDLSKLALC